MVLLQHKLSLKVSQRQILTPGLVQMVSVLALNKLELRDMITAEMVENPVLEELADDHGRGRAVRGRNREDDACENEREERRETVHGQLQGVEGSRPPRDSRLASHPKVSFSSWRRIVTPAERTSRARRAASSATAPSPRSRGHGAPPSVALGAAAAPPSRSVRR